jgi:hypothetical protein
MVSNWLSYGFAGTPENSYFKDTMSDVAIAVTAERDSFNIDKRLIATGANEEIFLQDLVINAQDEWWQVMKTCANSLEIVLLTQKPKKILTFSPLNHISIYGWVMQSNADLTFVNSTALAEFEQHALGQHKLYELSDYSSIEISDLEDGLDEQDKFDFISAAAWDLSGDPALVRSCVDALAPGGVLHITQSNHGTRMYRNSYHSHPYAEFHKILTDSDGYTYHVSELYGFTVFIKNRFDNEAGFYD